MYLFLHPPSTGLQKEPTTTTSLESSWQHGGRCDISSCCLHDPPSHANVWKGEKVEAEVDATHAAQWARSSGLRNNCNLSRRRRSLKQSANGSESGPDSLLLTGLRSLLLRRVSWYSAAALSQLRLSYLNLHSDGERDRAEEGDSEIDNAGHSPMTTLKRHLGREERKGEDGRRACDKKTLAWVSVSKPWPWEKHGDLISSLMRKLLYIWRFPRLAAS